MTNHTTRIELANAHDRNHSASNSSLTPSTAEFNVMTQLQRHQQLLLARPKMRRRLLPQALYYHQCRLHKQVVVLTIQPWINVDCCLVKLEKMYPYSSNLLCMKLYVFMRMRACVCVIGADRYCFQAIKAMSQPRSSLSKHQQQQQNMNTCLFVYCYFVSS